ncbi:hypothetical protein [Anthocerotibacter panamensis]|uniref:hypothetical protein n=1 Tax=Anthocerotibacter panamensis TaxID=2857077 RepID=UPI001C4063FD|nr:hypothetical protein [Anthocerotibacter panamensis]
MERGELDTQIQALIQQCGFMPVLNALRRLCTDEAEVYAQSTATNAAFFADFWAFAGQNLAAAELLILQRLEEQGQAKAEAQDSS